MRIDAYNAINQIYNTKRTNKVKSTAEVGGTDQVVISQFGRDYQIAKQAVAKAPDIREKKVESLKARIDSNTYEVDEEEFANKLIEKYFGK